MMSYHYLLQHELIGSVKKFPHKKVLILEKNSYTYEEFLKKILNVAVSFKQKNLQRGDRVVILSGNTDVSLLAFYATLFCNAIPCIIDDSFSEEVINELTTSLMPTICITQNTLLDDSTHDPIDIFDFYHIDHTESDIAMIMHTSGSTGVPKGVMLSHRNVLAAVQSIRSYLNLVEEDKIVSALPLHFDYGLYQVLLAISVGASLILHENTFLIQKIAHSIERHQATVIPCVPYLVQIFEMYYRDKPKITSVRMMTNTGEYLSSNHIDRIKKIFPEATIFSMYGLTECKRCSYIPPSRLSEKSDSIGIPMPNLEMWIEDDDGNHLPTGREGNLMVSGPTVMHGYWRNEKETAVKIKYLPCGKKVLITGDRAVKDVDGYYYFKGRRDFVFKFKGMKLPIQHLVQKINKIDCINRSYLFLEKDQLIVCVESFFSDDRLRLEILACFQPKQLPNYVFFQDKFPMLSNGKLDKYQLEMLARNHFYQESL